MQKLSLTGYPFQQKTIFVLFLFKARQDIGNLKAFLCRYSKAAPPRGWLSLGTIAKIDMLLAGLPDTSEDLTFEDLITYWNLLHRNIQRFYDAELEEIQTSYLHTVGLESVRIAKSKQLYPFFLLCFCVIYSHFSVTQILTQSLC